MSSILTLVSVLIVLGVGVPTSVAAQYEEFFSLSRENRAKELATYSVEQQLEIFVIAKTRYHPGMSGLTRPLAANGKVLVPHILKLLNQDKSRHIEVDLFGVLLDMSHDVYNVASDPETFERLRGIALDLEDRPKVHAMKRLDMIEERYLRSQESLPIRYEAYFTLPPDEQVEALSEFSLNEQLEIYVIARTRFYPGPSGLEHRLAEGGKCERRLETAS